MVAIWLIMLVAGVAGISVFVQKRRRAARRRQHFRAMQDAQARANDAARLSQPQKQPRG